MAKINLLPWRDALRKERNQQFQVTIVFSVIMVAVLFGAVHFYHTNLIAYQLSRNQFLEDKIVDLDKKIEEIKVLEKERARLKERIYAIEKLQSNRPLIVHLFDEIVISLPEGISLVSLEQNQEKVTITGVAQSNARVSSFMRKLESSEWLKSPKLNVIQSQDQQGRKVSNFTLSFNQVVPTQDEKEDEA